MDNSVKNMIGNTPIIKIMYEYENVKRVAFFKAEWLNFSGSIKDRVAYQIIIDALSNNKLKKGQKIVEVTSGNMGISLCAVAKAFGFETVIFMPKNMSEERKKIVKMYGAKLILTNSFEEAFIKAEKYARDNKCFYARQFENKSNVKAHKNTAKEILKQTKGNLSCFVAGMGTSGTLMGVGKYLKEKNKDINIIGVEPLKSQVFSLGKSLGEHQIQGLADDFVPSLFNKQILNKIIQVNDDDCYAMAQKLSKKFGLSVGISGGANFLGCVLSNFDNSVSVFPDDNKKYLSTKLNKQIFTNFVNKINLIDMKIIK